MSLEEETDGFEELFLGRNLSIENVIAVRRIVHTTRGAQSGLRSTLSSLEAGEQFGLGEQEAQNRLGAALWLAERLEEAEKALSGSSDATCRYLAARCCLSRNRPAEARSFLQKIHATHRTPVVEASIAYALRAEWKLKDAVAYVCRALSKHGDDPDLLCELAMCRCCTGEHDAAADTFDSALRIDPEHRAATFGLAYLLYQRGEDEEAVRLYEKCVDMKPMHLGAIANLAFIYEDMGDYEKSAEWLGRLHEENPSDRKVEFLAKFSSSCTNMYYDEEKERRQVRRERLLAMSIDDFELSIRSRKCLEDMTISSLGDLVDKTESELLAFNNFGETSLTEVKSILKQKGLLLKEEAAASEIPAVAAQIPSSEVMDLTLEESGLTTRVRKCLEAHGIRAMRDVCEKTEKDILGIRDFGRASLRELKKRLNCFSLSLKEE